MRLSCSLQRESDTSIYFVMLTVLTSSPRVRRSNCNIHVGTLPFATPTWQKILWDPRAPSTWVDILLGGESTSQNTTVQRPIAPGQKRFDWAHEPSKGRTHRRQKVLELAAARLSSLAGQGYHRFPLGCPCICRCYCRCRIP